MSSTAVHFAPVSAKTGEPLRLAMQRLWLTGRVLTAGARLTVQHVFRSEEEKPLEVIYSFPLPRDAALRAFRITGEGLEAHSELKPTQEAVKAYEEGIARGSLSTLARQYGDGIVNLNIGNLRPKETVTVYLEVLAGVELRDGGFRFRFPFTLAPAYHSRMKAAVTAQGEGEIELPSDEFGDVILPRFREDARSLHQVGFDLSVLHQLAIDEIGSPSHSIRVQQNGAPARVMLAAEKDVPNRDLVLDVRFRESAVEVLSGIEEDGKRPFAAVVPSTVFGVNPLTPRRTVILLDRSGSMTGLPMAQAKKAIEACLSALAENDSFGLIAFDNQVESLHSSLLDGSRENREKARAFLGQIDARGGTELVAGFLAASRMLDRGGDVLVLTDGQVAGTETILDEARHANIRIFCLGIGSASQDRFLSLLARETGGISRFLTPSERVDLPAVDLFASMGRPVASNLKTTADVQPEPPHVVFAGSPVSLFGELITASRELELTWDGGRVTIPVPDGDAETGQTIRLLQGSRLITDWESRYPADEAFGSLEKRKQSRVAARLAELSSKYGLASREMSLVAVVQRAGDRPGELPETRVVPVGMPQDTNFGAYFGDLDFFGLTQAMAAPPTAVPAAPRQGIPRMLRASIVGKATDMFSGLKHGKEPKTPEYNSTPEDDLLNLASQLDADGGLPGPTIESRVLRSIAAVFAFVAEGHTLTSGAFRSHVARLIGFIKAQDAKANGAWVEEAETAATNGRAPAGNWLDIAKREQVTSADFGKMRPA